MAISIMAGDSKKKYILIALGLLVVVLIIFVVWKFVLPKDKDGQIEPPAGYLNININFASLKNFKIREMKLFKGIEPFSGNSGRDNPFESVVR
ncbi:MAG: hypothetical protein V1905_02595 [bacterium]